MPAKTQSTRMRTSRARRTCKRGKGGMFRAASAATGRMVTKVMGKGLERVDKAKQVAEAIAKGMAQSQTPETFTPAKLSRTFSASPLSPYRMSETPRSSHSAMPGSDFKTPKKGVTDDEAPPQLGHRTRRRETQAERMRRLGFMVAPTTMNDATDATMVVRTLFH